MPPASHIDIARPAPSFRDDPLNVLVRICDITGLAVHAVRCVDEHFGRLLRPLVDSCWTKVLTRVPKLFRAALNADVRIRHEQVAGLIFLMLSA